jgi:Lysine-specific metallo-endopeptidase
LERSAQWLNSVAFFCLYENDGSYTKVIPSVDGAIVIDTAGSLFAYVYFNDLAKMYLGLAFFNAPATGYNSKLGTVIHELTHFWLTGNTNDIKYGKADCLQLARTNPTSALKNADNYEYFVEDWLK